MKIVILGGTGLIGSSLKEDLLSDHEVECFGRDAFNSPNKLLSHLKGSDLVIQLSGSTISKRWTKKHLKEVWESRVDANNMLAKAIKLLTKKPRVICASGVGYYPESNCENPLQETDNEPGNDYMAKLSIAWEDAAKSISTDVIILRFSVVLSRKGGALKKLYLPYFLGLGGPIKDGTSCFSWIHIKDLIKVFNFIMSKPDVSGIYNVTSPTPIQQKYFGRALARALKRPFIVPLFEWQLKLLFGSGSRVLTQSVSVFPRRLIDEGFGFDFPEIESAMSDLI
ncbi:MAG: TIGR01777 family oxidoreductase [Candidatus Thioglobus sp.]|nr:TIGR01777 family oxidoreductase [Candidatus Thioglobus sp.]